MDETVLFREALLLRRGSVGWSLLALGCGIAVLGAVIALNGVVWGLAALVLGPVVFVATWFGGGETVVTTSGILRRVRPLPRTRRIAIEDVASVEVVIADSQTSMFGGWEGSRGGLNGALVESVEGPQQVGNRAVRLQLRSGEVIQFATWKPAAAISAIRAAQRS